MTSKKTGYLLGAVAGAGVMAAAVAGAGMQLPSAHAQLPGGLIKASTAPIFAPPPGAPMSFADIFDRVSPAVVSINVTSRVDPAAMRQIPGLPFVLPGPRGGAPGGEDGEDGDQGGRTEKGQPRLPTQQSSGSGFFISADGYIVTNNHVVENAESIKVVLKDETELDAEIVGRDEATDLAVIKIKGGRGGPFPFVNFENAGKPRVGDWVITVGNPFGLGGTATAGIVSAYGRDIGETFVDYIQIDAPINRGNSGGPTFDVYGRVIGVNTAIFSPSGGSVGIGFAIPSDVAETVTKQLINGGKIERGYIGATIQNFTAEMAEAQGLEGQKGAIVADISAGGPSARAGVQVGDVVVAVNGATVKSSSDLTRQVARVRAGENLRLDVIRDGKKRTVDVRSGVRPSEKELAANDNSGGPGGRPGMPGAAPAAKAPVLGMSLSPLDEPARNRLNLPAEVRGALVDSVEQSSDAGTKGLRRGDVITLVNGRAVAAPAEFAAVVDAAKKAGRTSVLIGVYRNGRTAFLPIKVSG
ncbi:MAG: Do family serine endopeptidase [Alphaproteobacteria bacterium]|nr:Do family serine endopeptidase [Alphaproteobacteria bacterium]MBU1512808.1 Do family serine endopeptidase [Alphaproteobacteria bacterium]MBU2093984.1 Do family serine endopeptidase [Alphaproteobacteria bacterium]MBU2149988.1 Do family serine endopeptidase [Alphaproteobacteria bacterium]MBU2306471.1 Do family serine endopeptidase [Alphaproteobacteria bacterium]